MTVSQKDLEAVLDAARGLEVPASVLGQTGGDRIVIRHRGSTLIDVEVTRAYSAWKQAIPDFFKVT